VLATLLDGILPEVFCDGRSPPVDVNAELRLVVSISDGVVAESTGLSELDSEPVIVALTDTLDPEPDNEVDEEAESEERTPEELTASEGSTTVVDELEIKDDAVALEDVSCRDA
jgi:hypothetical protein